MANGVVQGHVQQTYVNVIELYQIVYGAFFVPVNEPYARHLR